MKIQQAETAIAAFHSEDRAQSRMRVARAILEETRAGRRACIGTIARKMGMGDHQISGRMRELKDAKHVTLDGVRYVMQSAGLMKNPYTGKTVEGWALVLDNPQLSLFNHAEQ